MPKTYNDLYLATRTALKNAGVEAYALEARLLVAYAVGKTKEEFVRDLRLYTSDENEQKIEALLQRRNHQNRTICLKADALEKPPMGIGTFDLIVSNPPYVASMDILTLDSSVRDYEPLGALDGGEDGLMFYRAIVRHWTQILRPGGWLMFEVGEDQADTVMALMTEEKYTDVTALEDTAGIRRVVVGRI